MYFRLPFTDVDIVHNSKTAPRQNTQPGNETIKSSLTVITPLLHITTSDEKRKQMEILRNSLNSFSKGLYVLLVDKIDHVRQVDVLCHAPWCAVFDLDQYSGRTGLLARIGKKIPQHRLLNKMTWQETKCSFSERSLNWIGITGSFDHPDSIIDDDFSGWKRKIKSSFSQQLNQLNMFNVQNAQVTVLALWPTDENKVRHMYYMIDEMIDELSATVVVVVKEHQKKTEIGGSFLKVIKNNTEAQIVSLELDDVYAVIQNECVVENTDNFNGFKLPTSDATNSPRITNREFLWLQEDLDVLYINNHTGISYTRESFEKQEDTFYRGGTLPWAWWYEADVGTVDIKRDIHTDIVNYIQTRHIKQCRSGYIKVYHNPGSGGTTAAQRVVWELRHTVPCLQIKHKYVSIIPEIYEKVKWLYDEVHLPIVVIVDGEDEHKADSIYHSLKGHVCIIVLYVQRYWSSIPDDRKDNTRGHFWLRSSVSQKEANLLHLKYTKLCKNKEQERTVQRLVDDIQNGRERTFLDFGLAVHGHEYTGVQRYVAGYLKLDNKKVLTLWQRALSYQSSLPCYFFAGMFVDRKEDISTIEDFPAEMQQLIVEDGRVKNANMVRISHHLVAKEILNQMLTYPNDSITPPLRHISADAKKKLPELSIDFIKLTGTKNKSAGSNLSYIMRKTFIIRNNKAVGETETQTGNKKKPPLSPLLEQVSSHSPYTERFDILQQLVESFPLEAQFRAHLGRLYTVCRPEKIHEAETCFNEALEISQQQIDGLDIAQIPYNKKVDLMHIYHMYGNMLLRRLRKETSLYKTGSNYDRAKVDSLLKNAQEACSYFTKSRDITPIGSEVSMGYICEIQTRLNFVDFAIQRYNISDVYEYIEQEKNDVSTFLEESCIAIDELFLECFSAVDPDKMDSNVSVCQAMYALIFKYKPGHVVLKPTDNVRHRQYQITKIKMKYAAKKNQHCTLENVDKTSDIQEIIEKYEQNFEVYESSEDFPVSKRTVDMDYKEWMYAIRHKLHKGDYSIEDVLKHVECWYEKLNSPHSIFYLFVLKSILGFGVDGNEGNIELMIQAKNLKDDVIKISRQVTRPKYPREWLGRPTGSIRRLYPGLRFFGQIEFRKIEDHDLEVRKGTICPPNDKPTLGFISLDVGQWNRVPVEAFFVPARAEDKLTGSVNKGVRVEFVVGFSMLHGYEAFNVKKLQTVECACGIAIEIASDKKSSGCPDCSKIVMKKRSQRK
mgnify:CR=1 FL=1